MTALDTPGRPAKESWPDPETRAPGWLTVLGIGDDGLAGLSPTALARLDAAEIIIGGKRHLAMLPEGDRRRTISWPSPASALLPAIEALRGQAVCILATGDPTCYGAADMLKRALDPAEMEIFPAPSAFSLARARLCWSHHETYSLTLHGRPLTLLLPHIHPGRRLLLLSWSGATPGQVARLLAEKGYSRSEITILEHMGGPQEKMTRVVAGDWPFMSRHYADLNTLAVLCLPDPGSFALPTGPGLPDELFDHDGQLTKAELRAMTLSALMPVPGQLLWDVGAGCGSVAIEWMRSHPLNRAVAFERHSERLEKIARNADRLGVPGLESIAGDVAQTLKAQDSLVCPDAIFVGGAVSQPGLLQHCLERLAPGGRLVANAVTVQGEATLLAFQGENGGRLTRLSVSRARPPSDRQPSANPPEPEAIIGAGAGLDLCSVPVEDCAPLDRQQPDGPLIWKSLAPVTQYRLEKPFL